ncbi:MAG: DUF5722 domain-containing protein [Lachnospiraceae bacterium]|nr:DUF5722 domain-containing protein [Lachnospiraceae bacterium]
MKKTLKKLTVLVTTLIAVIVLSNTVSAKSAVTNYAVAARCALTSAGTVSYSATLTQVPSSDDGLMYLVAMQPYEYSVTATDYVVAQAPASATPSFSFSLNNQAGVSQICNKFGLCVKVGGKYQMIANAQYITNPEVAATRTRQPQNVGYVEPYDKMVLYRVGEVNEALVNQGNYSTAVIVNCANPTLINPSCKIRDPHPMGTKKYYQFNAATLDGVNTLRASMYGLAANTRVDEFIFGNEVNTRTWNYMAFTGWDNFVREYAQAFRVAYNAIKSANANAKVYISLDQMWDRNRAGDYTFMDAADFMIKFNELICAEGNIDWNLAFHPYLTPLTYAKFWDMSGCPNGSYYVNQIKTNKMVSFQNLPVMTSMMTVPGMLNSKGQVREIILPEIGITSAQGYEVQAAAMMACYQACRNNPLVKRIYFHRMNEGGQLNFGTVGISEQVYQSLVRGNPGEYNQWALNYIGISDWRQIIMY